MKRLATLLAAIALSYPLAAGADSSPIGTFLNLEFSGKLVTDSSWNDQQTIADQMLYLIGQLNGYDANGRLDQAVVSNVVKTAAGGKVQITYRAKVPMILRKRSPVPATIELSLPLDISYQGQSAFAANYGHDCVDFGAHDVDAGSMFYYFRPRAPGCTMAAADVHAASGTLSPSPVETTGKFPEYIKVWEDNTLNVVAIFGKYEDGATTSSDAGISAYNAFISSMTSELSARNLTTVPATVPMSPGVGTPDIEFKANLPDGRKINVVALLTDNVRTALSLTTFRSRYQSLSTRADFIAYNGHSGLGADVRALAAAGTWVAGQYVVVFLNGSDSYAYIDGALSAAHKAVNPDDTTGSKYLDILANGMPSFFASMAGATMGIFRGLLAYDNPTTYEQILASVSSSQLVMVIGEQDNVFVPDGGGQPQPWAGFTATATVSRNESKEWSTPTLAAGVYTFTLTGSGDADLYVRIGAMPTTTSYDCRPYKSGSNESCSVTLGQAATINVMVRGYAATSTFEIVGKHN